MALKTMAWIALATIWGTTFLAIRVGLNTIPPITFAGMRFVLGAMLLGVTLRPRGIPLPQSRADWRLMVVTGLQIFALGFALQFWGQQFVPSGLTAVIFSAVPLLTMFVAHFRLGNEKISLQKLTDPAWHRRDRIHLRGTTWNRESLGWLGCGGIHCCIVYLRLGPGVGEEKRRPH